jgi:Tol biopolymer transport system component
VVVAGTATSTTPALAASSNPAPLVVYNGDNSTVTVRADGTAAQSITCGAEPALSPDGTRVACIGGNTREFRSICVVGSRGGDRSCFSVRRDRLGLSSDTGAVWSPDGTRLAFDCGDGGVCVALADGGHLRQIYGGPASDVRAMMPVWAPDGSALAFIAVLRHHTEVVTVRLRDRRQQVAFKEGSADSSPSAVAWSPDGTKLAFTRRGAHRGLSVVAPDGSGLHRLYPSDRGAVPVWSPDGSRIAFKAGQHRLETIAPDGSNPRIVPHTTDTPKGSDVGYPTITNISPHWTPDGDVLVFERVEGHKCYDEVCTTHDVAKVDLTTGRYTALTNAVPPPSYPGTQTGGGVDPDTAAGYRRLAGHSRIGTAISVSRATFDSADTVVVARSDEYPDALTAGPLAEKLHAPLLLSPPDATTAELRAEVRRLGAHTAYLIGDEGALSAKVATGLGLAGVTTIHRIGGHDRFDTAAMIAKKVGGTHVYLARGIGSQGWADAAAVSGLASYTKRPLLLARPGKLPDATSSSLDSLDAKAVTIIGGKKAVSPGVANRLRSNGRSVDRFAGHSRYGTSVAVADAAVAVGMDPSRPWLATGSNFPDALAAGPAAASESGVLLLVKPHKIDAAGGWLSRHQGGRHLTAVGGPDVVGPKVTTAAIRQG